MDQCGLRGVGAAVAEEERSADDRLAARGEPTQPAHQAVTSGTTMAVTTTLAATSTVAVLAASL